jgi:hypothetical protein
LPGFGLFYRKSVLPELKFIRGKCLESSLNILDSTRQWRNDMGMNTAIRVLLDTRPDFAFRSDNSDLVDQLVG